MTRHYQESDTTCIECSDCGHLHFDTATSDYVPCPLAAEGCTCTLGAAS